MSLWDMSGGQRHLNWARQIESNIAVPNITILNAVSENILLKQKETCNAQKMLEKLWKPPREIDIRFEDVICGEENASTIATNHSNM